MSIALSWPDCFIEVNGIYYFKIFNVSEERSNVVFVFTLKLPIDNKQKLTSLPSTQLNSFLHLYDSSLISLLFKSIKENINTF
jgi:hypothetical protein